MSIEGQGHFFTIYFPGFVCFVLYLDKISGERLQDHWSSGFLLLFSFLAQLHEVHRSIVVASAIGVPVPVTINVTIPIPVLKVFY